MSINYNYNNVLQRDGKENGNSSIRKTKQAAFTSDHDDDNLNNNRTKDEWPSPEDLKKHLLKSDDHTNIISHLNQANEIILPLSNLCGKKLSEVKALNIPSNGLVKKMTLSDCDDFANSHNQNNTEMIKDMASDNGKQDSAMSSSASSLTSTLSLSSRSSTCSTKSLSKSVLSDREGSYNQNDFIVIDYKMPFANSISTNNTSDRDNISNKNNENAKKELSDFYMQAQNVPVLKTFSESPTLGEQIDDLSKQLECFESKMKEYDNVLEAWNGGCGYGSHPTKSGASFSLD